MSVRFSFAAGSCPSFNSKLTCFGGHNGITFLNIGIYGGGYQNTGTNNNVIVGCAKDTQINGVQITDWTAADLGTVMALESCGFGCTPANYFTTSYAGTVACQVDATNNTYFSLGYCGPAKNNSLIINSGAQLQTYGTVFATGNTVNFTVMMFVEHTGRRRAITL